LIPSLALLVRNKPEQALRDSEERLRLMNEILEKRVEERTRELEQRALRLRQLATDLTLSEQRERQRLAMVLHDGLQQLLVAVKLRTALLERGRHLRQTATDIINLIDDAIETSRSLTAELSPPVLYQSGLLQGIEWLANWMHDKHGLSVNLVAREQIGPLPEEITILLFQALRELLFNVVKHAGVKAARVEVVRYDGHIQLEVSDTGVGFAAEKPYSREDKSGGMGLFSINERLSYLGGRMEIDSAPGKGSRFKPITPVIGPAERTESQKNMDGIQATRVIHKEMPHICIIGLSMFQEEDQAAAIFEAGAVNYLMKSGPSAEVIKAIRSCLRNRRDFGGAAGDAK
jgi:signal transduction histidine kinase